MRGTWDDLNRRLVGAILALDLHDALLVAERQEQPKRRFLGPKPPPPGPRRWGQVTAAQTALNAECVGSTSFGGEWEMSDETEAALLRQGWEKPWLPDSTVFQREAQLIGAPRIALATVRALELLGCQVEDLEVELTREEP